MELQVPFTSYKYLRFLTLIAGILGVAQSIVWTGMAIIALCSYNCYFDFTGTLASFGTILRLTIVQMYFRDTCVPDGFPVVDFTAINNLNLMTPQTVYIWMWVISAISIVWFSLSVALLATVKKTNLKYANLFLYMWIVITFIISIIDLVLFVLFIVDYNTIMQQSYNVSLNFIPSTNSILITAQNTAAMMASLSLRGYLLWLINLCLSIYLFTQTFKIYDFNRTNDNKTGQVNPAFTSDQFGGHSIYKNQPIAAYNDQPNLPWYNYLTTEIPRAQRPHSVYPPPMIRSKSASNLDENFQRRMTVAQQHQSGSDSEVVYRKDQAPKEQKNRQSVNGHYQTPQTPQTYEPRPQLRSAMRNSRYQ